MLIAAYVCGFLAVVLLSVGLAQQGAAVAAASGRRRVGNALTDSPIGGLVRAVANVNTRPSLDTWCRRLEKQHVEAGQPGGAMTGEEFLAGAELAGGSLFVIVFAMMSVTGGITLFGTVFAAVLGGGAVWLVHAWLSSEVDDRRRAISRQLPFFIDLGVMCMESGATLQETIAIYERDNPEDALAHEYRTVLAEVSLGKTLGEALEGIADRVELDIVRNFVNAVVQAQKLGTPISQILADQAGVMRFKRSQDAERAAEELKIRMQGPVILMMIAVFLLILGPAFLETMGSGVL